MAVMNSEDVRTLVAADEPGIASHGVSRTPLYVAHLRNDRVVEELNAIAA
jgi:LDH2 family malate/lactate/ureidoglycolate dehydrogenase